MCSPLYFSVEISITLYLFMTPCPFPNSHSLLPCLVAPSDSNDYKQTESVSPLCTFCPAHSHPFYSIYGLYYFLRHKIRLPSMPYLHHKTMNSLKPRKIFSSNLYPLLLPPLPHSPSINNKLNIKGPPLQLMQYAYYSNQNVVDNQREFLEGNF